jgi:hypothetical protein
MKDISPPPTDPNPDNGLALRFTFPDGVRGGFGKIRGEGEHSSADRWAELPDKLRACGATGVYEPAQRTHAYTLECLSSTDDEELVRRFKLSCDMHFSVARYNPEIEGWNKWDEVPFQKFWSAKAG